MEEEPKLVYSKLNCLIEDPDGERAIEVYIYRPEGAAEWTLEVVNHENVSWMWEESFKTEQDALNEVRMALKKDTMDVFYQPEDDED